MRYALAGTFVVIDCFYFQLLLLGPIAAFDVVAICKLFIFDSICDFIKYK